MGCSEFDLWTSNEARSWITCFFVSVWYGPGALFVRLSVKIRERTSSSNSIRAALLLLLSLFSAKKLSWPCRDSISLGQDNYGLYKNPPGNFENFGHQVVF